MSTMYQAHFGLTRAPFKITPDTRLFYAGAQRGSILQALVYAVLSGEGIIKVIGEVGTGKTMLCRMLEEKLPQQVETVYISNPNISPENILSIIAFELGLVDKITSKLETMQILQLWLLEKHANGSKVVVFIEEAQGMPLETLEEIRLLSNLETDQNKLLQIVLFGQPELDDNLSEPSIRQLNERIAHSFYLSPLRSGQVKDYLNFRIRSAGYHGPDLFNEKISKLLARSSQGLIRRINILADKILLASYAEGTTSLSKKHAQKAVADCRFGNITGYQKTPLVAGVTGLIAGVLIVASVWVAMNFTGDNQLRNAENSGEINVEPQKNQNVQTAGEQLIIANSIQPASQGKVLPSNIDILSERLQATQNWLNKAQPNDYSIQIMYVKRNAEIDLSQYLQLLSEKINLNEIYIYESALDGKPMYGLLYKSFHNKNLAKLTMNNIPSVFNENKPFLLRTVRGLKNEIARRNG